MNKNIDKLLLLWTHANSSLTQISRAMDGAPLGSEVTSVMCFVSGQIRQIDHLVRRFISIEDEMAVRLVNKFTDILIEFEKENHYSPLSEQACAFWLPRTMLRKPKKQLN